MIICMGVFPKEFKRRRLALGMSQAQLAVALKVNKDTVSTWERGEQNPRMPEAVLALMDTLQPLPKTQRRAGKSGRPREGG